MMKNKISVLMITYNHENYVAQAIDSVLSQRTDFPFELVIGEDCSTDGTGDICRAYRQKHPDIIRLISREKNLGMAENFMSTLAECKGRYLAILEGDDFWSSPEKLQKQANFLDSHPEYSLVFTKTKTFFQDDNRPGNEIPDPVPENFTLENLLRTNFIATCSVMYRHGLVNNYPKWFSQLDILDWPMHVLHSQHGKIGYIDERMAVYRRHRGNSYANRNLVSNYMGILKFYRKINSHLNYQYKKTIYWSQARVYREIAILSRSEKRWLHFGLFSMLMLIFRILARTVQ